MAAQDLTISRRGPAASDPYYDSDPGSPDSTGPDGAAVLFSTLRKRWLLLVVIGVVSGGLAMLAAWQFGKETAVVKAAIIYIGLPSSASSNGFDPLNAATGAEMLTSVNVLSQLCVRRGLDIPPARLAERITTNVSRSSSLINLSLVWRDVDDGIALLNELTAIFIEEMAGQRKSILLQHLHHLDLALLQAKGRVDEARSQVENLLSDIQKQRDKDGPTNDKYRTAKIGLENLKAKKADKETELKGTKRQSEHLAGSIDGLSKQQSNMADVVKKDLLREAEDVLSKTRSKRPPNSDGARQLNNTVAAISRLVQSPESPKDLEQWQKKLAVILQSPANGLTDDGRKKLDEAFAQIQKKHDGEFIMLDSQRRKLEDQRSQLELSMILVTEQIASITKQIKDQDQETNSLDAKITGDSASQLDEAQHTLQEAEKRQDSLAGQSIALRQLSETQLREWTVTVPASMATAEVASNRAKLFVVVFGVCCFALSAPLFVSEWHAQSDSPQVQLARSLRVPVLAERILEHFSPSQRKSKPAAISADQTEIVRMLTLRIQQTCHRPGSVVLFSSLDAGFSTVPLMASIAECLAEREERVLIIDAVCPRRALIPVLNVLSSDELPSLLPKAKKKGQVPLPPVSASVPQSTNGTGYGLSEYFSEECEDIGDLVQPTGCPGVDLIASGHSGFSREAMASSCLTELLNNCRKNYTMVLIHGPAIDSAADLQMLTARSDGVVLTATKESAKDPHVCDVVQDLLDLGAPLIGLVA